MYDNLKSNYFVFGNVDSRRFHAYVFDKTTHDAGARVYNRTQIPGRSGDFVVDTRRVNNVVHEYQVIITDNFEKNLRGLRSALLSLSGYQRLDDTFHKDEYYMAVFEAALSVQSAKDNMGKCTISFNRKPQRYLKSGEEEYARDSEYYDDPTEFANFSIYNSTPFDCKPLINVTGGGSIYLYPSRQDPEVISAMEIDREDGDRTTIDCELMEAYDTDTGESVNSKITTLINGKWVYPYMRPGETYFNLVGLTYISIVPRWYMM